MDNKEWLSKIIMDRMDIKTEIEELRACMGGKNPDEFQKKFDFINAHFTTEADSLEIDNFISSELSTISNRVENCIKDAEIRLQLMDVKEIVSLSYIANRYFNKTRSWLHQKINGNIKNGKLCSFSSDELDTLNYALKDISQKIGSIAIHS